MHINFVAISDASFASHRFRINKPYELLTQLGYKVSIKQFVDEQADVNVFQKHIEPEQILDWMERTKTKKIFDVCDDHFDRADGPFYKEACAMADVITCTNTRMEKRLKELFPDKPVYIFYDPINTIEGEPKWSAKPKVIWYGHQTNFGGALPWLQETVKLGYDLTVVSNMDVKGTDFKFVPFEQGWVEENLKNYDVVLLPQSDEPWVNMKSENRFVDALNAGCVVIYNNEILYEKLKDFGLYTDGTVGKAFEYYSNIENMKENKNSMAKKLAEGVKFVRVEFSDEKIKEQLEEIINGTKTIA